jgi:hypothetical protein
MGKIRTFLDKVYNSKRFNLYAFGIIAVLILIAYSNTFTASFHFDDNPSIMENAAIRHITLDNIVELLRGVRPVVYLSIMLNYAVSGLNVVGWHSFNIGVHIINSIFVYLFILWTLTLPVFRDTFVEKAKRMALFGALLFAVHPVQTESVTYIISRTELLATCFYLATFLLFIKGARTGKFSSVLGMFGTALLAMGSKEWAVTLPAMLALYDFMFFSEGKFKPVLSRWYIYLLTAIPWSIVLTKMDLMATGGSAGIGFNIVSTKGITAWTYLLTSLNVLWTYLRLLVLPIHQNLDYDYPIAMSLFEFPTVLSFLGHIAVVAAAFWLYKKKGWLLLPFGIAWFYIGLSPVQSFVPIIDVIFEHRVYMPSIGIFLAFIVGYEGFFEWWEARRVPKKAAASR